MTIIAWDGYMMVADSRITRENEVLTEEYVKVITPKNLTILGEPVQCFGASGELCIFDMIKDKMKLEGEVDMTSDNFFGSDEVIYSVTKDYSHLDLYGCVLAITKKHTYVFKIHVGKVTWQQYPKRYSLAIGDLTSSIITIQNKVRAITLVKKAMKENVFTIGGNINCWNSFSPKRVFLYKENKLVTFFKKLFNKE